MGNAPSQRGCILIEIYLWYVRPKTKELPGPSPAQSPGQVPTRSLGHNNEQTMRSVPGIWQYLDSGQLKNSNCVRLPLQWLLSMMFLLPPMLLLQPSGAQVSTKSEASQRFGLKIGRTPPACYCQLLAMSGIGIGIGSGFGSGCLCWTT